MNIMRRAILSLALIAGMTPAFAQVPPPVPALPDTERRTSYSISASTCACSVGFQLYGDSTDVGNWLVVAINGVEIAQAGNWTITSPTGQIGTIARPITDAVLTFLSPQTGTVQIVGARRPRRVSQVAENAGVPARNFNQTITDLVAQNRETWDRFFRVPRVPPGETLNLLPPLSGRASMNACFDSGGNLTSCVAIPSGSFAAGTGIIFTGANPTVISSTQQSVSPGNGITITGSNPAVIAVSGHPSFGPVVAPWPNALGDSLFTNAHATTALPSLIASAMGWGSINTQAVSGATIADQASIYGWQMTPSLVNPALIWLGTNDVILDADNRITEQTSLEGYRATLMRLAIPTGKVVTGQAMTVAAGSWSNLGPTLDPGGTQIATNGAVKRGVVTGRHVVVAGWANLSSNGTAAVSIGNNNNSGNVVSDVLTFKRPVILTNSPGGVPTQTIPFVRVYKNVGIDDASKLTVSVGVTSATGAGNDVFISYVAGLSGNPAEAMPLVAAFKLHNFTLAGEAAQGTTATRRERFVRGMGDIVDELNGLGLWVVPIDSPSVLWDTSLLGADGVHPGDSGNAALTTEAVAALAGATNYWIRRKSELNNRSFDDTLGGYLFGQGRLVIEDFRRIVKARAATGSGFSVHNNNVTQGVASGGAGQAVVFSTEAYDVASDFASDTWTPIAGQVSMSAALTFTASVDQTRYEVWITKNGSTFKRIGVAQASGTGELQVSGTVMDITDGTAAYRVLAFQNSGGAATISGDPQKTWFTGMSAY